MLPGSRGVVLSAAGLLGAWVAGKVPDAMLLGPDEESAPWVVRAARQGAEALGKQWASAAPLLDRVSTDTGWLVPPTMEAQPVLTRASAVRVRSARYCFFISLVSFSLWMVFLIWPTNLGCN